jgi:steroid 5-alpha reductase family enzyme
VNWQTWLLALGAMLLLGSVAWLYSVWRRDVSIVDSLWSLFFLLAALIFAATTPGLGARGLLLLVLVAVWSIRLSMYITQRKWGHPEDYRYQAIRANNEPRFWLKSWYIVFGLQAVLAWIICLPLLPAITVPAALGWLDTVALLLFLTGLLFEAGGDYQLARFKRDSNNKGRVLDSGLWRYTRHPNYFCDFCIWWAFYLFAVASGAWWTIASPLLMTFLLLRVSGVAMLEKTIGERRPDYVRYVARTNAFFPGPRRAASDPTGARQ